MDPPHLVPWNPEVAKTGRLSHPPISEKQLWSNKAMPCPSLSTTKTVLRLYMSHSPVPSNTKSQDLGHQPLKPIKVCSCHFEVELSLFFHFPTLTSFFQRGPTLSPYWEGHLGHCMSSSPEFVLLRSPDATQVSQQSLLVFHSISYPHT